MPLPISPPAELLAALGVWEHATPAFAALDLRGRLVYTNRSFSDLVGFRSEVLRGTEPPHPFWHPDELSQTFAKLQLLLSGEWEALGVDSIEARFRRADGRIIDIVFAGSALRYHGELSAYAGFVIDQSDRRPPEAAGVLAVTSAVTQLREDLRSAERGPSPEPPAFRAFPLSVTARERHVLVSLLEGMRVASIARHLGMSPHTVRNHLKSLFRKTGLSSQAALIERFRDLTPPSGGVLD